MLRIKYKRLNIDKEIPKKMKVSFLVASFIIILSAEKSTAKYPT
jgi:hypothetical protein